MHLFLPGVRESSLKLLHYWYFAPIMHPSYSLCCVAMAIWTRADSCTCGSIYIIADKIGDKMARISSQLLLIQLIFYQSGCQQLIMEDSKTSGLWSLHNTGQILPDSCLLYGHKALRHTLVQFIHTAHKVLCIPSTRLRLAPPLTSLCALAGLFSCNVCLPWPGTQLPAGTQLATHKRMQDRGPHCAAND